MGSMHRLAVGTEKGGYLLEKNGGWSVVGPSFPGWKVTAYGRASDGTHLAAIASNWFGASVHRSPNFREWEQVEAGPSYPEHTRRQFNQVWTFTNAGDRVYAGVDEAGLFYSDDHGLSWSPVGALNDHPTRGEWQPGFGGLCAHRVLVTGDRIVVGISAVGVFRSDDGGMQFDRFDAGVTPTITTEADGSGRNGWCVHGLATDPANPDRIWRQDHRGVYRTTDGGESWQKIEEGLPSNFGFAIGRDHESSTLFLVPLQSDENRLPRDGDLAAYRSTDNGDTWEKSGTGWPEAPQFTGVLRNAISLDQQGGVAFGTTGGRVFVSVDRGDNWQELPFAFPRILSVAWL